MTTSSLVGALRPAYAPVVVRAGLIGFAGLPSGYGPLMVRLTDSVATLAHDVSSNVASIAHDMAPKVSSLAQDVASRAQDAAVVAGKQGRRWGGKAVEYGRHNLEQAGVIAKPTSRHRGRNILLVLLVLVGGAVLVKVLNGRSDDDGGPDVYEAGPSSQAVADADRGANHQRRDIA